MIKYLFRGAGLTGALLIVAAALLFLSQSDAPNATAATYFNPCVKNALAASAPSAPTDLTTTFGIGLDPTTCTRFGSAQDRPGEWNSGGLIYFTPPGWGIAKDADIPDGTKVGDFKSEAVLGILNNGCQLVLNVNFSLLKGTIDQSKGVEALPPGSKDRLSPLAKKDANGVPAAATGWPTYLTTLADPSRLGWDLSKVIGRFVGVNTTDVQGTTVILNFLVFEPGALVSNKIQLDPRLGYPAVTILQDPTGIASSSDPVNDFCAPLWTESTLSGTVGGKPFRSNPKDGTYDFTTYIVPAPDADNDGIENTLDPCPYIPDTSGWDPRAAYVRGQTVGDVDVDGLPVECDPDPTKPSTHNSIGGGANSDEDGDGWMNRADNCPLIANPLQEDADSDGIGDACDQNINTVPPETVDGRHAPVCIVNAVTVGTGGAAPPDPQAMAPCDPNAQVVVLTGTPGPTPTVNASTGIRPTNAPVVAGGSGVGGPPGGGIGSLSPTGTDVPLWAAILAALGALGLAFGLSVTGTRIWRRR